MSQKLSLLRCFPSCGRSSVAVPGLHSPAHGPPVGALGSNDKEVSHNQLIVYVLPMVRRWRALPQDHGLLSQVLRGPPWTADPQLKGAGVTPPVVLCGAELRRRPNAGTGRVKLPYWPLVKMVSTSAVATGNRARRPVGRERVPRDGHHLDPQAPDVRSPLRALLHARGKDVRDPGTIPRGDEDSPPEGPS